jgi:hypothetical protein
VTVDAGPGGATGRSGLHRARRRRGRSRRRAPHEWARDGDQQTVGGLAQQGEGDDGGENLVRLAELLPIDEKVAQPFRRAHELRRHDEHETKAEAGAQRHECRREYRRKENAPRQGELR